MCSYAFIAILAAMSCLPCTAEKTAKGSMPFESQAVRRQRTVLRRRNKDSFPFLDYTAGVKWWNNYYHEYTNCQ
jgi:hypothetical protein